MSRKLRVSMFLSLVVLLTTGLARKLNNDKTLDEKFLHFKQQVFETKDDLLIYKYEAHDRTLVEKFGYGSLPKREEVGDQFPQKYYDRILLGILQAGSKFRVVRIAEEGAITVPRISYFAIFDSNNALLKDKEADVTFLANPLKDPPEFDANVVANLRP